MAKTDDVLVLNGIELRCSKGAESDKGGLYMTMNRATISRDEEEIGSMSLNVGGCGLVINQGGDTWYLSAETVWEAFEKSIGLDPVPPKEDDAPSGSE